MLNLHSFVQTNQAFPAEVRPFLPALEVLLSRLNGLIDINEPDVAFLSDLVALREEEIMLHLLSMQLWQYRYEAPNGERWDITQEAYSDFISRHNDVTRSHYIDNAEYLTLISTWIISLCDWEINGSYSGVQLQ
ncbi:hypothetical protein [Shewanella sp.]|uniref:hypothetical protein n=1 Tax=Shewanella sp. TaxID=50422 RepID=UPI003A97C340